MVTVMIGLPNNLKKFVLHKSFACFHSPVLHQAFSGPSLESQTQIYTIDDFDFPDAFGAIMDWMYTERSSGFLDAMEMAEVEAEGGARLLPNYLYIIWVLADRLLMPKLQNRIMDVVYDHEFCRNETPGIPWVYKNTTPGSKLRRFVIYRIADDRYSQRDRESLQILPTECLVDWALSSAHFAKPGLSNEIADFMVEEY